MRVLYRKLPYVLLIAVAVVAVSLCAGVAEAGKAYMLMPEHMGIERQPLKVYDTDTHTHVANIAITRTWSTYYDDVQVDMALSPSGDKAYVLIYDYNVGYVAVVDVATDTFERRLYLPRMHWARSMDVSPDGNYAYILASYSKYYDNRYPGYILTMDLNTGHIVSSAYVGINTDRGRVKVSPDGSLLFMAKPSTLLIYETQTLTHLKTIGLGGAGVGDLVFSPDGTKAYASSTIWNYAYAHIMEIDTTTLEVTHSITGESGYRGIAVSPDNAFVYATSSRFDRLTVLDAGTFEVVAIVDNLMQRFGGVWELPNRIAFSPDGTFAYITCTANGRFGVVVDTGTHEPIAKLPGNGGEVIFVPDNAVPQADAGADLAAECTSTAGAVVTLDASASSDPDGDVLAYTWSGPFGSASGVTPTVAIPYGTSTVTLSISDGKGGVSTDTVNVTVSDNTPPSSSVGVTGTGGNAGWFASMVTVGISAADGCSGVTTLDYAVDGQSYTVAGSSATVVLTDGMHTVTFSATDAAGHMEQAKSITLNVDATPPVAVIEGIADGAEYSVGLAPAASYTVTDATSGVAASGASLTGGDAAGLGAFTYTVMASDNAGNTAAVSASFTVIATPEGLSAVLSELVASGLVDGRMFTPLMSKINAGALDAFVQQVNAQRGKKIEDSAADRLIAIVTAIASGQ